MPKTALSGLLEFLEGKSGVGDVKVSSNRPATSVDITSWERVNRCSIPDDLRSFYLTHNGFSLQWSYQCNERVICLGSVDINSLTQLLSLCPISATVADTLALIDADSDVHHQTVEDSWWPSFQKPCQVFSLTYSPTCGHTCLVYPNTEIHKSPSVWLLDLSLSWHFLSPSFSDYLRLAVVHLGLKQWPYSLTPNGLSPHYQKWFHMFIPKRLELDTTFKSSQRQNSSSNESVSGVHVREPVCANSLDVNKLLLMTKTTKEKRAKDGKLSQAAQRKAHTFSK